MIVLSLAGVILIWVLALQIWDVTTLTRSLLTLRGWIRLIVGAAFAFAALALLYVTLPPFSDETFSFLSIVTFITALAVEFIIGDDVRRFLARKQ